jgi:hypothetical protein
VYTVLGSNPTEVTTVCEVMLFVCHELRVLSLPANTSDDAKALYHFPLKAQPNSEQAMCNTRRECE